MGITQQKGTLNIPFLQKTRHPAYILALSLMFLLASCAPQPVFNSTEAARLPTPTINVYLRPADQIDMATKRILMAKMRPQLNQRTLPYLEMTKLIEDVFLQSRLFAEIELADNPDLSVERLIDLGAAKRYDYIMLAQASSFYPSGNSRGWVGLDVKFIDTSTSFVVWHLYGEVDLLPKPGDHGIISIFYSRPFKRAQDPAQGLIAITRAMTDKMAEPAPAMGDINPKLQDQTTPEVTDSP
jgi:hypothetical protein